MSLQKNDRDLMDLSYLGFNGQSAFYYQLTPDELTAKAVALREGVLTAGNVLAVDTGEFTGRSPKDRFIVKDELTRNSVWWGEVNIPMSETVFDQLLGKMVSYISDKTFFVRDASAGAEVHSSLTLRVITETAYQNLFACNLFIRPEETVSITPEWTIMAAPSFRADPKTDGTRRANFAAISFTQKMILIGGTGYTGEIKKAVFSVMNFLLPRQGILSMHCAANSGADGRTAIFFGLSGTGKTTLSADPERHLIGDDEHGWSDDLLFNFEGGCYAKTVGLDPVKEPQIYAAIKPGALLENIGFYPGTNEVDYTDISRTENTRVSYPIHFIKNALVPSVGVPPGHVFFLTCDAFGVLPPVSKLNREQVSYYFLSGYTAKVAGTEHGINEPQATFSACFGKAFLPLYPKTYAELLDKKINSTNPTVWLINTGWTGGAYGTGERIKLAYTRAIIKAALSGELDEVPYETLPLFELLIPRSCPGVPPALLNPVKGWEDAFSYWIKANQLWKLFKENYQAL